MTRVLQSAIILYLVTLSLAKTFTQCELYKELQRQGFPQDQLNDWMCLIEAESSRRTHVQGGPNSDGSHDHGLFQINDRYWCNPSNTHGKSCNVRCSGEMVPRPSQIQLEKLVQFLEEYPGIAKGHIRSAQARRNTKIKWDEVTVNSLGGATEDTSSDISWAQLPDEATESEEFAKCKRALCRTSGQKLKKRLE